MKLKLTESTKYFDAQFEIMEKAGLVTIDETGVPFAAVKGECFTVKLTEAEATVVYTKKNELFKGAFMLAQAIAPMEKSLCGKFELCGEMIDNSRNAVMKPERVAEHVAIAAAFGLNCIYLYNEDTFEVEGEPYFGYMRGRYTKAEMQYISDTAAAFGLTLIPCIQTLAHHNQTLRWACYAPIKDLGDTLLVNDERTYALIEKMVSAWRAVTDSKYINIGMDEAYYMGRGKGLDRDGAADRFEMLCNHLRRVVDICAKYGFSPMMWSDMFFRIAFGGYYGDGEMKADLAAIIPEGVSLVYWDYYTTEQSKYARQIERHQKMGTETVFAGGAWKWSGFTPAIDHSITVSVMALDEAIKHGIKQVMLTCWGDDGADCLYDAVLPVLSLYGAHNYSDGNEREIAQKQLLFATGYTEEDFVTLSYPRVTPCENNTPYANPTKYLLYNDVLKGMFDRHTTADFDAFYKDCADKLNELAERESRYSYLFGTQAALCEVLALKATVGVKLKAAYDSGDRETLLQLATVTLPEIIYRIESFRRVFRNGWHMESKPTGFDTQDIRLGGIIMRVRAAIEAVTEYLNGQRAAIEELEEERLFFDCRGEGSDKCLTLGMNSYSKTATVNIL